MSGDLSAVTNLSVEDLVQNCGTPRLDLSDLTSRARHPARQEPSQIWLQESSNTILSHYIILETLWENMDPRVQWSCLRWWLNTLTSLCWGRTSFHWSGPESARESDNINNDNNEVLMLYEQFSTYVQAELQHGAKQKQSLPGQVFGSHGQGIPVGQIHKPQHATSSWSEIIIQDVQFLLMVFQVYKIPSSSPVNSSSLTKLSKHTRPATVVDYYTPFAILWWPRPSRRALQQQASLSLTYLHPSHSAALKAPYWSGERKKTNI